jgi:hypothetical protein
VRQEATLRQESLCRFHSISVSEYRGDLVTKENRPPLTFVERVLQLLEERFPWLGKEEDAQISGADTVNQLTDLYRELMSTRRTNRRNARKNDN